MRKRSQFITVPGERVFFERGNVVPEPLKSDPLFLEVVIVGRFFRDAVFKEEINAFLLLAFD